MATIESMENPRYDRVSALFHWITAALVISAIGIVFWAENAPNDELGLKLVFLHKSLGLTIGVLVALRILWRLGHKAPPHPPMPAWQHGLSRVVHIAFYVMLLSLPVTGYLLSANSIFPLEWFGIEIPKASVSKATSDLAGGAHGWMGWIMIWSIVLHIAAALYHQYGAKDALISRMSLRG